MTARLWYSVGEGGVAAPEPLSENSKFTWKEDDILKLFHLDRCKSLQTGQDINLLPLIQLPDEVKDSCLFKFFPDGISKFGFQAVQPNVNLIRYVSTHDVGDLLFATDFQQQKSFSDMRIMELLWEAVRQAHFSQTTSRLLSLFAVKSISAFAEWPELIDSGNFVVWELDVPDDTPRFDSNFLKAGECFTKENNGYALGFLPAAAFDFAVKYWSGSFTSTPRWEYLVRLPVQATHLRMVPEQEVRQHLQVFHQWSNDEPPVVFEGTVPPAAANQLP